ncbi:MAG: hypothetical protein AAGB00_09830 [Planctomycetota bacterium]
MFKLASACTLAAFGTAGLAASPGFAYETDDYGFLIERPQAQQRVVCPPQRAVRQSAPLVQRSLIAQRTTPAVTTRVVRSTPAPAVLRTPIRSVLLPRTLPARR